MKKRYQHQPFYFKKGKPDYDLLNEKIEVFKASVSVSNSSLYIKDLTTNNYPFFSFLPMILSGYSNEEVVGMGKEISKILIPADDYQFLNEFEPLMYEFIDKLSKERRKHIVASASHRFIHKDGYSYSVLLRVTPIMYDDKGRICMILGRMNLAPKKFNHFFYIDMDDTGERFVLNREKQILEKAAVIKLTDLQKRVLMMSNRGLLEKEICEEMNVSFNTLKTHKRNLIKKLDADNINDAYHIASIHRLL